MYNILCNFSYKINKFKLFLSKIIPPFTFPFVQIADSEKVVISIIPSAIKIIIIE